MIAKATANFRKNLQALLTARGVTQRALAKRAGISYPYVNRILRDKATPAIDICDTLADACGCSLNQMIMPPATFAKSVLENA